MRRRFASLLVGVAVLQLTLHGSVSAQQRRGARRQTSREVTLPAVSAEDHDNMMTAWAFLSRALEMGRLGSFGRDYEIELFTAQESISKVGEAEGTRTFKLLTATASYLRDAGIMGSYKFEGHDLLLIQQRYGLSGSKYEWAKVILSLADRSLGEAYRLLKKTPQSAGVGTSTPGTPAVVAPKPAKAEDTKAEEAKCSLTVADSPELRGFRLGMPLEEVQRRFPGTTYSTSSDYLGLGLPRVVLGSRDPQDPIERSLLEGRRVYVYPDVTVFDATQFPEYEGVSRITLGFVDNRVRVIELLYHDDGAWKDNEAFVKAIAERLNLPSNWKGNAYEGRQLTCDGWNLKAVANSSGLPRITLTDTAAVEKKKQDLGEQRRAEEERKRRAFKS